MKLCRLIGHWVESYFGEHEETERMPYTGKRVIKYRCRFCKSQMAASVSEKTGTMKWGSVSKNTKTRTWFNARFLRSEEHYGGCKA